METALRFAGYFLSWFLIGFLTVCIANFFNGPKDHEEWLKFRKWLYALSLFGPILTIFIICDRLFKLIKAIWKFCRGNSLFIFVARISDWMIAGFRRPPASLTKSDDPSDFPTASP